MTPEEFFIKNCTEYAKAFESYEKRYNQIAVLRIASALLAIVAIVYFIIAREVLVAGSILLLFLISFIALVKWHNRIKYSRDHSKHLIDINKEELLRLSGDLSTFNEGIDFENEKHPYSNDLDVFGRNSLFQLLNRTTTVIGRKILANWLLTPASKQMIIERNEAVKELSEQSYYCLNFEAVGKHHMDAESNLEMLEEWLGSPNKVINSLLLRIATILLPIAGLTMLTGVIWFQLSIGYLLLILLNNGIILKTTLTYSLKITQQTEKGVSILSSVAALIKEVEQKEFYATLLQDIKTSFITNGESVSTRINKLRVVLDFLNSRANMLYQGFNLFFLIDLHMITAAEKWKNRYGDQVYSWFDRICEFEVIVSLARFSFANPEYSYARISDESYLFDSTELGHPLIKSEERVYNHYSFSGEGSVEVITGSNMSGKSTFLRTIGINVVLALMGAPVCAKKLVVSRLQLFTSMRTKDNLEEHISSFYAELKRIELLLQITSDSKIPVLYMLDEILKGTNSHDRHKGAVALIKQLHKTKAFGFISTHDLELGQEAEELTYCFNHHFSSDIVGSEIIFDYKIKPGICNSFNASSLMKNIGIEIE